MSHHAGTKFKDYTVQGMSVAIYVTDVGRFEAKVGDRWIEKKNLPDLQKQIRELIASMNRVRIDATIVRDEWHDDPPDFTDILITGYDTRRGPLYSDLDGEGNPEGNSHSGIHSRGDFYRRLTAEERQECIRLWQAKTDAEAAYRKWLEERQINTEEVVGQATAAALAQPTAEEPEA